MCNGLPSASSFTDHHAARKVEPHGHTPRQRGAKLNTFRLSAVSTAPTSSRSSHYVLWIDRDEPRGVPPAPPNYVLYPDGDEDDPSSPKEVGTVPLPQGRYRTFCKRHPWFLGERATECPCRRSLPRQAPPTKWFQRFMEMATSSIVTIASGSAKKKTSADRAALNNAVVWLSIGLVRKCRLALNNRTTGITLTLNCFT